ncbi:MAG: penicillin-binding protein 2 [Patescibacteria group bacterium]|nr:penicillin-binding protein 2 [Patescibacteria group bacterium]
MDKNIFPNFSILKKIHDKNDKSGSFLDIGFDKKNRTTDINKNFIGSSFKKENSSIFLIVIFFLLSFLLARVFYLQVIKGDYYFNIAEGNRIKTKIIKAKRGIIYDHEMKQLVYNRPNFFIEIIPNDFFLSNNCDEITDAVGIISKIFKKEEDDDFKEKLKKKLQNIDLISKKPVIIVENINYQSAMKIIYDIKQMSGINMEIGGNREYLLPESISHWIGYTGRISKEEFEKKQKQGYFLNDYIGKSGLEKYYENILKGKDGEEKIEVDALGKEKKIISQKNSKSGNSLLLSIDYDLQEYSEKILKEHLEKENKTKGVVVAINPQNGEILSLVSLPSFSANDFACKIDSEKFQSLINDPDKPLFDRAIKGEYPSGSIIKPVIALSALEEGIITEWTTFLSTGGIRIGSWFFPDWRAGGHGKINVKTAIANSVNTFFYIIGGGYENFDGLGVDKIKIYGEKFGLNAPTGIDLPHEEDGFLPSKKWKAEVKKEKWYIGDTYHLAIGQGDLLITPIQASVFTSIVANRGTFYKPRLVKEILDEEKKVIRKIEPEIVRDNFVSSKNIKIVAQGMRDCVTSGSCRILNNLPIKSAGKTGTAQHIKDKDPHAWFICFAPFDNPEIALTVLIEEGGGGASVSAPIAKEILQWYFEQKNFPIDRKN